MGLIGLRIPRCLEHFYPFGWGLLSYEGLNAIPPSAHIHNVFSVSKLGIYQLRSDSYTPTPDIIDGEEE